jgi:phospholipid/cholesterol/gamma-HCH transport system permease protein
MSTAETTVPPVTAPAPKPAPRSGVLAEIGAMTHVGLEACTHALRASRYFAEILRQCAILVTGTTLVVVGLVMVIGGECGLFGIYLLRPLGATSFAGLGTGLCGLREMWPYMFAYIFAAKVGCGLVAEIGSMRISEEIDALESVAVDPMSYIVATRLLAVWLTVPFMYAVAMVFGSIGSGLVDVVQIPSVSYGQWSTLHWAAQSLTDNLFSLIKVFVFATVIALVGMYYGYRAGGGAVGVGAATARSMMVNLVLIHVVGAVLTNVFWGVDARTTIGG